MIISWHLVSEVKDNKAVMSFSSEAEIEPRAHVERYCRVTKTYKVMSCSDVVKKFSGRMAGFDKNYMVTLLYKTPVHARRQYFFF